MKIKIASCLCIILSSINRKYIKLNLLLLIFHVTSINYGIIFEPNKYEYWNRNNIEFISILKTKI